MNLYIIWVSLSEMSDKNIDLFIIYLFIYIYIFFLDLPVCLNKDHAVSANYFTFIKYAPLV